MDREIEEKIFLRGRTGFRLSLYTGMLEKGFPDRWSTLHFYHAYPGCSLALLDCAYEYAVAIYSMERPEHYIYTYDYQREENWSTYQKNMKADSYVQKDYIFTEECYFRVNIRRCDQSVFTQEEEKNLAYMIEFTYGLTQYSPRAYFQEEIQDTIRKVNEVKGMKFFLLSDTHYVVNGTWEDTIENLHAIAKQIELDGVIHLGDLTDGMVSREVNLDYIAYVMNDLQSIGCPLYITLGNHDCNYFYNNPERFTEREQYQIYLEKLPCLHEEVNFQQNLYYYKDYKEQRLRMFFLHSFDPEQQIRYGFSEDEVQWFAAALRTIPKGYRVLVFSHVPPLPEIHFWSDEIRNGERMVELAEQFDECSDGKLLGWIHGHNHAEAVYRERKFPIVSIGCNKCEYFEDKKPEGSYTYFRKLGEVSQDLWDVLIIPDGMEELRFIRFGAGDDKVVAVNRRGEK